MQDMNEDQLRRQLETRLTPLDWSAGIPKSRLVEHLRGEPDSQRVVDRGLAGGIYFSPADVLASLPASAWEPSLPESGREPAASGGPLAAGPFGRFGQRPEGHHGQSGPAPGVPDPLAEKTAAAAAVGVGLLALAGVALWVGRRLSQR